MSERFERINLADVEDVERELICHGLFYRGLNNKIVGPTGSGKTLLATRLGLDAQRAGEVFAHLDMEIGEAGSKSTYLAHGATLKELAAIHYVPMPSPRIDEAEEFVRAILDARETLAVFDKKPDFLRSMQLEENSNDDTSDFYGRLIDPLREKVTTVILAPTGHAGEHGRGSRGRGASEDDYKHDSVWQLSVTRAFDRARVGLIALTCTKDRWGYIGVDRVVEFEIGGDGNGKILFRVVGSGFQSSAAKKAVDLEDEIADRVIDCARQFAPDAANAKRRKFFLDWLEKDLVAHPLSSGNVGSKEQRIAAMAKAAHRPLDQDGLVEVDTGEVNRTHPIYEWYFRSARP